MKRVECRAATLAGEAFGSYGLIDQRTDVVDSLEVHDLLGAERASEPVFEAEDQSHMTQAVPPWRRADAGTLRYRIRRRLERLSQELPGLIQCRQDASA